MLNAQTQYRDIIFHRHHVSQSRPHMSVHCRAAQFAPFAALTGYDDIINESARCTEEESELDESRKTELNDRLVFLLSREQPPEVTVIYFVPDMKKAGGQYLTFTDRLTKYDPYRRRLLFASGLALPVDRITDVTSPVLDALNW